MPGEVSRAAALWRSLTRLTAAASRRRVRSSRSTSTGRRRLRAAGVADRVAIGLRRRIVTGAGSCCRAARSACRRGTHRRRRTGRPASCSGRSSTRCSRPRCRRRCPRARTRGRRRAVGRRARRAKHSGSSARRASRDRGSPAQLVGTPQLPIGRRSRRCHSRHHARAREPRRTVVDVPAALADDRLGQAHRGARRRARDRAVLVPTHVAVGALAESHVPAPPSREQSPGRRPVAARGSRHTCSAPQRLRDRSPTSPSTRRRPSRRTRRRAPQPAIGPAIMADPLVGSDATHARRARRVVAARDRPRPALPDGARAAAVLVAAAQAGALAHPAEPAVPIDPALVASAVRDRPALALDT